MVDMKLIALRICKSVLYAAIVRSVFQQCLWCSLSCVYCNGVN